LGKVASEIVLRYYLTIGFTAWLGLAVLAATSNDAMVRRLGGLRWRNLHQLIYPIAVLGAIHYFMQSKLEVFEPTVIGGRRYVDGGVRSPTSLGMMARAGVDEVFVLAPMASVVAGRPRMPHERLERQLRALITMTMLREVRALRAAGIGVTVLTPGPEDLAVMGVNLMDPRRRRLVFETSLSTSAAALASPAGSAAEAVA